MVDLSLYVISPAMQVSIALHRVFMGLVGPLGAM